MSLECRKLMEHINQHQVNIWAVISFIILWVKFPRWHPGLISPFLLPQRNNCSPAGLLPCCLAGHFLKVRGTFLYFKAFFSEVTRWKIWEVNLLLFYLAGFAVRQRAMWTASRGSEQSHVTDQLVLPPAAHLCSGKSSLVMNSIDFFSRSNWLFFLFFFSWK